MISVDSSKMVRIEYLLTSVFIPETQCPLGQAKMQSTKDGQR